MTRRPPTSTLFPYTTLFRSWRTALAKTANALLAHYCFVQALWRQCGRCQTPGRACSCRLRRPDFSDWGKAHRLLARLHRRPDLSQFLRHISARAHRDARTACERIFCRRDLLRSVRLSASPSSTSLVRRLLDLLRPCLSDQRLARNLLSSSGFPFAFSIL